MSEPRHIFDASSLDHAPAYRVVRLARLLRIHLMRTMRSAHLDLTPEQWFLVFRLKEKGPCPQSELAEPLLHDVSNITRLLDKLQQAGWVERIADTVDRRRTQVRLTQKGKQRFKTLWPSVEEARKQLYEGFSDRQIADFLDTLDTLEQRVFEQLRAASANGESYDE